MSLGLAKDDEEAAERAKRFRSVDPFPEIPRALLSSAEIEDYVRVTAMLHPFYPNEERLKSASYEVRPGRNCYFWNEERAFVHEQIPEDGSIMIPRDSIRFLQIESRFRLPDYIAVRFNLRIKHVHRGLLLGTGPLVDPGFDGDLLVPLHNLTSDDYEISINEGLIWLEFTKTSWRGGFQTDEGRKGIFRPFQAGYIRPETYFYKASGCKPIQSSIPLTIQQAKQAASHAQDDAQHARQAAEKAQKGTERLAKLYTRFGWGALAGLMIALAAIVYSAYNLVAAVGGDIVSARSLATSVQSTATDAKSAATQSEIEVTTLRGALALEKNAVDALYRRQESMQQQINDLKSLVQARQTPGPSGSRPAK